MRALLCAGGWCWALVAAAGCLSLRRRLELVARAEHELRGPLTLLCLTHERREPALAVTELERLRAGLADLAAARTGGRRHAGAEMVDLGGFAGAALAGWAEALLAQGREARLDWRAGAATVIADRGKLAQALGNLLANAAEHGSGPVELRGRRTAAGVRVEVRNAAAPRPAPARRAREERGRGLAIAAGAAEGMGGRLSLQPEGSEVVAALELPLVRERDAA